jgi:hypothetical protein
LADDEIVEGHVGKRVPGAGESSVGVRGERREVRGER